MNLKKAKSGSLGGRKSNPNKGFGSKTPEELHAIAMKGVEARRRKRALER